MTTSAVLKNTPGFIKRLAPLPGMRLPQNFKEAVSMLRRPYIPITAEALRAVEQVAGDSDAVLFDGKAMTFGDADGGYALMPLSTPSVPESVALGSPEAAMAHDACNAPTYEELLTALRKAVAETPRRYGNKRTIAGDRIAEHPAWVGEAVSLLTRIGGGDYMNPHLPKGAIIDLWLVYSSCATGTNIEGTFTSNPQAEAHMSQCEKDDRNNSKFWIRELTTKPHEPAREGGAA